MVTDLVSRDALRARITRTRERNFAPWSVMPPVEWAETVRRMPDEHGATKAFSFDYAPYEREMFNELFEPRNQEVVFQLYSRGGKSEVVLNALGWIIHQRPCRIGVMWPTLGQAKKWSKDDFNGALIEPTPELCELIGDGIGRRKSDNTLLHKLFSGGLIDMIGANAPGDIRRLKARVLYCDEIDAIKEIVSDEGDQLAQMKKRGAEFADTIEIYCSYPSLKRKSRIEAKLLKSDYREWFATCVKCGGEPYVMHRRQLRFDSDKPELARLECPQCNSLLEDHHRDTMMRAGKWRPRNEFKGRAGFHANSLLWPHPVIDRDEKTDQVKFPGGYLHKLAQEVIDAETADNPERARRTVVNMSDAETYEAEFEHKPEHTALFLRREEYDPSKMLPAGVLAIFFFVDVQGDRLELFIDGYGQKNQVWGLDYQIIKGTPLAPSDQGCWAELDRIVSMAKFAHPCGRHIGISGGLVDCGYKPDNVFGWTRPRSRRRIYASRGATTLSKPLIGRRPKREGNPPAKVWEIGTNEAKDIIYQRLELDNAVANGFCHFPKIGQFSEQYFAMLVAEDSEMKRAGDGKFYRAFSCDDGVRNEALDGRVGTMAIERIVKPNYAKLSEELAVKAEIIAGEPTKEPVLLAQPKPAQPKIAQQSFVQRARPPFRRPGGFVRGW